MNKNKGEIDLMQTSSNKIDVTDILLLVDELIATTSDIIKVYDKKIPKQPPENEEDNKEYKRHLKHGYDNDIKNFLNKRASQMKNRLFAGEGKAIYMIGVEDNGEVEGISLDDIIITLNNINKIANIINAKIKAIRIYKGNNGFIATVRLFLENTDLEYII